MKKTILMDSRLKSKIDFLTTVGQGESLCYLLNLKDIEDSFCFNSEQGLYNFIAEQVSERFYDKELRKGYFDYVNEDGETLRYHIVVKRGSIVSYNDENLGKIEG